MSVAAGNAEGAVYGTVMVGVLLAAEDTRHEGFPQTVGAGAIILALYWLAHFCTHTLAIRLTKREELNATLFWQSCVHELPVIEGAIIPVLVLLVAWAAGATVPPG